MLLKAKKSKKQCMIGKNYLNTKHANIKFTSEKEVNGSLPFLDVLIS